MPADTPLTDDYVASVLQRDAEKKGPNRFVASGLGSLLSGRSQPRSGAPKPNSRFLKNLVRHVDSYNTALKAKEEEESRKRIRELKRGRGVEGSRDSGAREGKRRRSQERYDPRAAREKNARNTRRRRPSRSRSRSRSPARSPEIQPREHHHRATRRHRDDHRRARSPGRRRKPSRDDSADAIDDAQPPPDPPMPRRYSSDSDPLEATIGPQPAPNVTVRGRGAHRPSNIDARFDPDYDPNADLDPDAEVAGDWDLALEALRDRTKWRKTGAERLRAAGFAEEEVERWETGGGGRDDAEKDVARVKWSKRGEGREWDRMKVLEGDRVEVRPNWGRLKGT